MADHAVLLRDHRQLLVHPLADARQRLATRAVQLAGLQLIHDLNARQIRRQCVGSFLALARMRRDDDLIANGFIGVFRQQLSFVEQLELIGVFLRSPPEAMGQQAAQPFLKALDLALFARHLTAETFDPLFGYVEFVLAVIQILALLFDRALLLL